MKMRVHYLLCMLMVVIGMSCSSDNENGGGNGSGGNSPLKPDDHKVKLEEIGKDFVAKFKVDDHKVIISSLKNLGDCVEDSDLDGFLPDYLQDDEDHSNYVGHVARSLADVIEHNNVNAMVKAMSSSVDRYLWEDFTGIFKYNGNGDWIEVEKASDKLELHYTVDNVKSVFAVVYSGNIVYDKEENVVVEAPSKLVATLKVDDKEQMMFTCDINLANDKLSGSVAVKLSLTGDYVWVASTDAKGDLVKLDYTMSVKGEMLMSATAEMTGTKMTDPGHIEGAEDVEDVLKTAKFEFMIMDVRLTGNGNIKDIVSGLNKINEEDDKKEAEQEAQVYNDYAKIEAFYVSDKQKVADIKMGAYTYEEEDYRYNEQTGRYEPYTYPAWGIQPYLIFTSDNSLIEFESFFTESGFSRLIDAVEVLANQYGDLLGCDKITF